MQTNSNERGFHVVELVLIVVLVGILGFIGFRVWQARQQTVANSQRTTSVPAVKSTSDLDKVDSLTNQLDTDNSKDLDKLEQDITSL